MALAKIHNAKSGDINIAHQVTGEGASSSCLCRAVCIYEASSPEAIHEHTLRGDLPVTEIIAIADTVVVRQIPPRPPRKQTRDNTRTRHRVAGRDTDGHVAGGVLLPPA